MPIAYSLNRQRCYEYPFSAEPVGEGCDDAGGESEAGEVGGADHADDRTILTSKVQLFWTCPIVYECW